MMMPRLSCCMGPKRSLLPPLWTAGSAVVSPVLSTSMRLRRRHDFARVVRGTAIAPRNAKDRCGRHFSVSANAQRPKRFYRNVQVVPVEEERVLESFLPKKKDGSKEDDTMLQRRQLLFPRPPSPQLVPQENKEADDDASSSRQTWWTMRLDDKPLRTPSGRPLYIPSATLAHGMAAEWNAVTDQIVPQQMPLMTLVCTVLDQVLVAANPTAAATFRQQCLQYMATDTICYYADPKEERALHQQQQKAWQRLHTWIATSFLAETRIPPPAIHTCQATTNLYAQATTTPFSAAAAAVRLLEQPNRPDREPPEPAAATMGTPFVRVLPHDPALRTAVVQWIATLDAWHLVALYVACKETKSFWLGVALLLGQHSGAENSAASPGADTAWVQTAARVEEEWNIRDWGFVEGQHDYDRLNCAIQLRSVAWLVQCLQAPPRIV